MIQRFSHCAHWGAFTVVVDAGRIVGIEPFVHDPAPSPVIQAAKDWLDPARRIAQQMVRKGWLEKREQSDRSGRGREDFVPVSWEQANKLVAEEINRVRHQHGNDSIFAGSYGWTSAGRFHHAQTQIKRLLNLVGGFTGHKDTYSYGAGAVIARHVMGSNDDYLGFGSSLDSVAQHSDLLLAFGGLSPRTSQMEAGGIARHTLESHLHRLVDRGGRVILVSPRRDDIPEWVNAQWWPIIFILVGILQLISNPRNNFLIGIIFILLGVIILGNQFIDINLFTILWPIFLILIGLTFIIKRGKIKPMTDSSDVLQNFTLFGGNNERNLYYGR